MLDVAAERTGMAEQDIVSRLCPSELGLEEEETTPEGQCRALDETGSCRACWMRYVRDPSTPLRSAQDDTERAAK